MTALLFALSIGLMPVGTSIITAADGSLQCHASGDVEISPDGKTYINGTDIHVGDNGTQDVIVLPSRTLFLKYTPADAQSWTGLPPAYIWDALNRIAAAMAASGHRP